MEPSNKRKIKQKKKKYIEKFIDHQKRKRSEYKNEKEEKELKIFLSNEAYERKSIFDFQELPKIHKNFNGYTHFQRKAMVEDYYKHKNGQYTINELLALDDTNVNLQMEYAKKIVDKINLEKDTEKIKILEEKIIKSQIIIDEGEYNKIIEKIMDKNLKKKLSYINYKSTLINTFEYILEKNGDDNSAEKAKETLKISKKFNFNKWANMGENNFYFYKISLQLFDKINEIIFYYSYYQSKLEEIYQFLKNENFDELSEDKRFRFNYISFIILDKRSIKSAEENKKINNFLYREKLTKSDLNDLFKNEKSYELDELKEIKFKVEYDTKKSNIKFKITENRKINKKKFSYTFSRSYNSKLFNKNIIELIKKHVTPNFDSNIMENTLPILKNQLIYYNEIKKIFVDNLVKILKSEAAKNFFKKTYRDKYPDLIYHFDRKDVMDDILQKINFFPIFKEEDNGFTNPVDMSIIINSIPGKLGDSSTHSFNRKILYLGMLLIISIHEIFGHYMHRYYSLLTGREISFDTPEKNDDKLTGNESGYYIESKFIGLEPGQSHIGLKKCLALLYSPNLQNYPIIKKQGFSIDINILKIIYNDNKELFNFIITDENDEENNNENEEEYSEEETEDDNIKKDKDYKEEDNSNDRIILLEDYLDTLINIYDVGNSFRHSYYDELYFIHLDKINDYAEY